MKLNGLHRLNIRCSAADLVSIENFYTEVVGLQYQQQNVSEAGYQAFLRDPQPATACGM